MTNTLFIGKVYRRFDELPSTNDWAADLIAKSKPPEGTVVRADSQSAGRGQFGSHWESAAGKNLTLSIILYPTWLEAPAQFYLSMAVALALRDVAPPCPPGGGESVASLRFPGKEENDLTRNLRGEPKAEALSPPPGGQGGATIKWPNDLYLGPRKAAGILIQNTLSGQYLQASVVGIGLNINQTEFSPALPNPTSLALYFGRQFDPDEVAERLFECLERRYLQLKTGQRTAIREEYERSLFRFGVPSRFVRAVDGVEFTGIIRGVTQVGRLRVETENDEDTFEVKEIRFVV